MKIRCNGHKECNDTECLHSHPHVRSVMDNCCEWAPCRAMPCKVRCVKVKKGRK